MAVEIRKLLIKGVVQSSRKRGVSQAPIAIQKSKREMEKEVMNLRKLKRDILRECNDLIHDILERKSNRY